MSKFLSPFIIEQQPALEQELANMSDNWQDLENLLNFILTEHALPKPSEAEWSQVAIRGETDGTMGLELVKQIFTWNPKITLILSGGVYGRENTIGDIGSVDLFHHLERDLVMLGHSPEEIKNRVIIDSLSQHTGHQGQLIPPLLKAMNAHEVFIVMPIYHMPRFLLTVAACLKTIDYQPLLIPLPYGTWQTHHPRKGPNHGIQETYRYEELFALPPQASRFPGKFDCGEISKITAAHRQGSTLSCHEFLDWYQDGKASSNTQALTDTTHQLFHSIARV